MNEELKALLTSLGTDLIQKAKDGIDAGSIFVSAQAPELIKEVMKIGIFQSLFSLITFFIVSAVLFITAFIFYKKGAEAKKLDASTGCSNWEWSDEGFGYAITSILSVVFGALVSIGIFTSTYDLITRLVAPRLYIISQLKQLFFK